MKMFRDVCKKKALTRRYASTSPASGRGEHQLTALLIAPSYTSEVDFAKAIFDDCHSNAIPDNLIGYFDCDAFARDLFIGDYFSVEADGQTHIFSNY